MVRSSDIVECKYSEFGLVTKSRESFPIAISRTLRGYSFEAKSLKLEPEVTTTTQLLPFYYKWTKFISIELLYSLS